MKRYLWSFVCTFVLLAGPAHADVWDTASDSDNNSGTDNDLVHGTIQVHDLAAQAGPVADQDWFLVYVPPYSSFEVVVDSIGGDLNLYNTNSIQRLAADASTVLQNADGASAGVWSMRLAWRNATATAELSFIRIMNASCSTTCTTSDQYRILARETTVYLARFNNAGSQITVLLSQNASDRTANATYYYWSTTGALLQTGSLSSFAAKSLNVFNTASFGALAGVGGHITVAHDAPYGTWNVKTVALEASTGFSFDTPGVIRPY